MCIQVNKVRSQASDIFRTPLGGGDSTDRTSHVNLRKLNFTITLYQLTYSLVLLQHLSSVSKRTTAHSRTTMPLMPDPQHRSRVQLYQLGVECPRCRVHYRTHNCWRSRTPRPCPETNSVECTSAEYQHQRREPTGNCSTLCGSRIRGTRCQYDGHTDQDSQSEKLN